MAPRSKSNKQKKVFWRKRLVFEIKKFNQNRYQKMNQKRLRFFLQKNHKNFVKKYYFSQFFKRRNLTIRARRVIAPNLKVPMKKLNKNRIWVVRLAD